MPSKRSDEFESLVAAWHAHRDADQLYRALRGSMRHSARQGLRRVLGQAPNDDDVDQVVLKAFREVVEKDPKEVVSWDGLAATVAYRRGIDRGRSIRRERDRLGGPTWPDDRIEVTPEDQQAAADREQLLRRVEECMEGLTPDQREVIELTVMQQKSLSVWASERGVSYEAARRMRLRGLKALERCADRKSLDSGSEAL